METGHKPYQQDPSGYHVTTAGTILRSRLLSQSSIRKPLEELSNIIRHSRAPEPSKNTSIGRILAPQKKLRTQVTKVASSKIFELQDLLPYHQYHARQRRENNADGDAVWDEETENAFMD